MVVQDQQNIFVLRKWTICIEEVERSSDFLTRQDVEIVFLIIYLYSGISGNELFTVH